MGWRRAPPASSAPLAVAWFALASIHMTQAPPTQRHGPLCCRDTDLPALLGHGCAMLVISDTLLESFDVFCSYSNPTHVRGHEDQRMACSLRNSTHPICSLHIHLCLGIYHSHLSDPLPPDTHTDALQGVHLFHLGFYSLGQGHPFVWALSLAGGEIHPLAPLENSCVHSRGLTVKNVVS